VFLRSSRLPSTSATPGNSSKLMPRSANARMTSSRCSASAQRFRSSCAVGHRILDLDERENLRSSSLCEFDRARHGGLRYVEPGLRDSACAEAAGCFWLQPATRRQVPRLENRCSHARRLPRNRAHGANPRRELQRLEQNLPR
jgi:hypothetical protein